MKKKEVEKLIKECLPNKKVTVKIISNIQMSGWAASISINDNNIIMSLNRSIFLSKDNRADQIGIILHEIGHTFNNTRSVVEDEYLAQKWAIITTRRKGWKDVEEALRNDILSWGEYTWNEKNGEYRRYILASKKFKKEKI